MSLPDQDGWRAAAQVGDPEFAAVVLLLDVHGNIELTLGQFLQLVFNSGDDTDTQAGRLDLEALDQRR